MDSLALVGVGLLDGFLQVFHLLRGGLRVTEVSLLDKEQNVSLLHLLDNALELVSRDLRLVVTGTYVLGGRVQTLGNQQVGQLQILVAYLGLKAKIELRVLVHCAVVVERSVLTIRTTGIVVNGRSVLFGLLTYVGYRLAQQLLVTGFQYRSNGQYALLGKLLLGERTRNIYVHLVSHYGHRARVNFHLLRIGHGVVT